MPTLEELGQKVKAKYPGAYDDLSDADVAQKVQEKFPGAYDDYVPSFGDVSGGASSTAQPPHVPTYWEGVKSRLAEAASNPLGAIGEVLDRPLKPIRESIQEGGLTGEMGPDIAKNTARTLGINPGVAGGFAEGLERNVAPGLVSGPNVAMAAASAAFPPAGAALAGKFAKEGAGQVIEGLGADKSNMSPEEKGRSYAQMAGGAGMVLAPLLHEAPSPREVIRSATEPAARLSFDDVRPEDMGAPEFNAKGAAAAEVVKKEALQDERIAEATKALEKYKNTLPEPKLKPQPQVEEASPEALARVSAPQPFDITSQQVSDFNTWVNQNIGPKQLEALNQWLIENGEDPVGAAELGAAREALEKPRATEPRATGPTPQIPQEIQDAATEVPDATEFEVQAAAKALRDADAEGAGAAPAATGPGQEPGGEPLAGAGAAEREVQRAANQAARSPEPLEAGAGEEGNPRELLGQAEGGPEAPAEPQAAPANPLEGGREPAESVGAAASGFLPGVQSPGIVARQVVANIQNNNIDLLSRFKNKAIRNLQFTEKASPRAAELLAGAGAAEQRARVMAGGLTQMARRLGLEPEEAIGGLVDSNQRGMKQLYEERRDMFSQYDPQTIREMLSAPEIQQDIQRLNPRNEHIMRDLRALPLDSLKKYLVTEFDSAAKQVNLDPQFEQLRQTPNYQKWLAFYKESVGDKLRQYHAESGGSLLDHLGPDDAYFPLTRTDVQPPLGGFNKYNPFKTATARSQLRTGRAGQYDVTPTGLVKPLAEILKKDSMDAAIDKLVAAGAIQKLKRTTEINGVTVPQGAPDQMMLNGRIERAVTEDLGNGYRLAMPETLHTELKPIFDTARATNGLFKGAANVATNIQMLGPVDPIYHGANVLSAAYRRFPALAYGLAKAAEANPNVTGMYGKFLAALDTDPFSEANRPVLDRLLSGGQVQPRWGRESYTKAGAELTGGKTLWRNIRENPFNVTHIMSPALNGPRGLDIRVRIAFEKAIEGLDPNASWATRHAFTSEMGDYNRATQPQVIGALKSTGLSPFATAGWNFNKLGLSTLNPFPTVPGGHTGIRIMQGALTSAAGHFAMWQLAHLAITGMLPATNKSDLFTIPMTNKDGSRTPQQQAIVDSWFGKAEGLDVPGAKLSMNIYSLPARGLRMVGGQALYNDTLGGRANKFVPGGGTGPAKKAGDIARDMAAESFNTIMHPVFGPPIRAASRFLGMEPSLISTNTGFKVRSTIPAGTPSDKILQENLKSGLTGVNPLTDKFLTRGEDPKQLEPEVATKLIDLFLPRLVVHPQPRFKYHRTSQ